MSRVSRDKRYGNPLFHPFSGAPPSAGKALKKQIPLHHFTTLFTAAIMIMDARPRADRHAKRA